MYPIQGPDDRFNSYLQFIRPSRPQEPSAAAAAAASPTTTTHNKKVSHLHIDTDSLGISYTAPGAADGIHASTSDGNRNEDYYSDIFRRLNFPHDRHRRSDQAGLSSHSHHHHRRHTSSSVPATLPQLLVDHPPLSPSPSPSSSSSSAVASPIYSPLSPPGTTNVLRRDIPRNKCQIRRSSITSPSSSVSAKSWEHIRSPAASFLASFASPVLPPMEEQDGDEIDDYILERVIGTGGFSTVRSGYSISDGHKVAVKVIKKTSLSDEEQARLDREIDIWKTLDHPHLVTVEKILETDHAMYIVCTYCSGGSLLDLVNRKGSLSESEARAIIVELCSALQYLHNEMRICHKDIKLENILLDDQHHVKLCDFGLAVHAQPWNDSDNDLSGEMSTPDATGECAGGSLAYVAPEQIKSPYCIPRPSTDMWSIGVVIYALVTGRLPFQDDYDVRLQNKILQGHYDIPEGISVQLQQLLHNLLQIDPRRRCTAQQVVQSPWCSNTTSI